MAGPLSRRGPVVGPLYWLGAARRICSVGFLAVYRLRRLAGPCGGLSEDLAFLPADWRPGRMQGDPSVPYFHASVRVCRDGS